MHSNLFLLAQKVRNLTDEKIALNRNMEIKDVI